MSNYIENPLTHPEWDPSMGDFFSKRVFEEDKLYEKKQQKRKIFISSMVMVHVLLLFTVMFYFS